MKSLRKKSDHPDRVQLIHSNHWWDGTLEGICKYQGNKYYKCAYDDYAGNRIFSLHEIPENAWIYKKQFQKYWNNTMPNSWDFNENNYRINEKNIPVLNDDEIEELKKWLDNHKDWEKFDSGDPVGYFDYLEFRVRKTLHRPYFIHGEDSRYGYHKKHCGMADLIEWRTNASRWHLRWHSEDESEHEEEPDFDDKSSGWCISYHEASGDTDHGYFKWLVIDYCPWCQAKLPKEPPEYEENRSG